MPRSWRRSTGAELLVEEGDRVGTGQLLARLDDWQLRPIRTSLADVRACVVVFLPILFGERTQITIYLAHVAVPIVVAMTASLIIAQPVVPMLIARFPAPPHMPAGSIRRVQDELPEIIIGKPSFPSTTMRRATIVSRCS